MKEQISLLLDDALDTKVAVEAEGEGHRKLSELHDAKRQQLHMPLGHALCIDIKCTMLASVKPSLRKVSNHH
jgi:hypothetical protein